MKKLSGSKKYNLSQQDLLKVFKGAIIAMTGAFITYLSGIIGNADFGVWTPIATASWSIVVNLCHKYMTDTTAETPQV